MILVTGATGNIGKELVHMLSNVGHPVRILVRSVKEVAHLDSRIERVIGDLDAPNTLDAALKGVNKVFLVTLLGYFLFGIGGAKWLCRALFHPCRLAV